jgi:hypothetical protein
MLGVSKTYVPKTKAILNQRLAHLFQYSRAFDVARPPAYTPRMNHMTPSQLLAHHLNLALLPRNHAYQPAVFDINGQPITVLRHAEGKGIRAVAVCGDLQLRTEGSFWEVYQHEDLLLSAPNPLSALDCFTDELGELGEVGVTANGRVGETTDPLYLSLQ